MKTTKEIMLDDENAIDNIENNNQLLRGLIGLCIAVIIGLTIWSSTLITQSKALQSKCDSLEVSVKSLTDNLVMPVEIRKSNGLEE